MPGYKVTISNSEGNIEFSTSEEEKAVSISSVIFRMNTLNNDTLNRSDSTRIELEIKGMISENNKDNTHKLLTWAIDNNQKTLYRDVSVIINNNKNNTGEILRTYELKNMFVIDYEEFPNEKNQEYLDFRLFIAQKEDAYDGVKTYPY